MSSSEKDQLFDLKNFESNLFREPFISLQFVKIVFLKKIKYLIVFLIAGALLGFHQYTKKHNLNYYSGIIQINTSNNDIFQKNLNFLRTENNRSSSKNKIGRYLELLNSHNFKETLSLKLQKSVELKKITNTENHDKNILNQLLENNLVFSAYKGKMKNKYRNLSSILLTYKSKDSKICEFIGSTALAFAIDYITGIENKKLNYSKEIAQETLRKINADIEKLNLQKIKLQKNSPQTTSHSLSEIEKSLLGVKTQLHTNKSSIKRSREKVIDIENQLNALNSTNFVPVDLEIDQLKNELAGLVNQNKLFKRQGYAHDSWTVRKNEQDTSRLIKKLNLLKRQTHTSANTIFLNSSDRPDSSTLDKELSTIQFLTEKNHYLNSKKKSLNNHLHNFVEKINQKNILGLKTIDLQRQIKIKSEIAEKIYGNLYSQDLEQREINNRFKQRISPIQSIENKPSLYSILFYVLGALVLGLTLILFLGIFDSQIHCIDQFENIQNQCLASLSDDFLSEYPNPDSLENILYIEKIIQQNLISKNIYPVIQMIEYSSPSKNYNKWTDAILKTMFDSSKNTFKISFTIKDNSQENFYFNESILSSKEKGINTTNVFVDNSTINKIKRKEIAESIQKLSLSSYVILEHKKNSGFFLPMHFNNLSNASFLLVDQQKANRVHLTNTLKKLTRRKLNPYLIFYNSDKYFTSSFSISSSGTRQTKKFRSTHKRKAA